MDSCSPTVPENTDLCPFYRGDTIPFSFEFKEADGSPMDISDMVIYYTMKLDIKEDVLGPNDLQSSATFPADTNSMNGLGELRVLPTDTEKLLPDRAYAYDFQLVGGVDEVYTVGQGTVSVLRDVTQVTV